MENSLPVVMSPVLAGEQYLSLFPRQPQPLPPPTAFSSPCFLSRVLGGGWLLAVEVGAGHHPGEDFFPAQEYLGKPRNSCPPPLLS